eukprot:TRINITY_DN5238_c0_g1_i1.p1 TRINITY_DN5238_c0_g1~~TRINITY_DN5238_c0_g1_i1.p1  ORF type:complete len:296 (+),score=63.62 TRINITY_DN5238_c0_g1_i1:50-889(+)
MSSATLDVSISLQRFNFDPKKKVNVLTITNAGSKVVAYKLKLSSPLRYVVRPRMGYVEPGSSEDVSVTIRVETLKDAGSRVKDKFQLEVRELNSNEAAAKAADGKGHDRASVKNALNTTEDVPDLLTWLWKSENIPSPKDVKKFFIETVYESGEVSNPVHDAFTTPRRTADVSGATPQTAAVPDTGYLKATPVAGGATPQSGQGERIQNENAKLKAELADLEQRKNHLKMKSKEYEAASEELRSKSEKSGMMIPAWLFIMLCFASFYTGLVFDKFNVAA